MSDLTLLCVTDAKQHSEAFLSHFRELSDAIDAKLSVVVATGVGCIENVLDEAVASCDDGYILRLDDDETLSMALVPWIKEGAYRSHDHWAFPRWNLWPDADHHASSLWPDLQTRLSTKEKAGGRSVVHSPSPFGTGHVGPPGIVHWKFIVRSYEERLSTCQKYEAVGAHESFRAFSLPEDVPMTVEPLPANVIMSVPA